MCGFHCHRERERHEGAVPAVQVLPSDLPHPLLVRPRRREDLSSLQEAHHLRLVISHRRGGEAFAFEPCQGLDRVGSPVDQIADREQPVPSVLEVDGE